MQNLKYLNLMLITLRCPNAFLTAAAPQNTAQNLVPPCQLGNFLAPGYHMDILAPVPKTSNNTIPLYITFVGCAP